MARLDFIHSPPNEAPIETLYAYLSFDDSGNEGVVASIIPGVGGTQLVTGRERVAEMMKDFAREVAHSSGKTVRLVKFTRQDVIWTSE